MDAKVKPLVAALVIAVTIISCGIWAWANGKAKEFGGPSGLFTDPAGHLYVQIRNQLLEHDARGEFLRRHDLSALGIDKVFGGMDFFSNGDVLLRRGPDTRTLSDNLRAYRRETNRNSLRPDAPDTGLYRCNLGTLNCKVFGAQPIDFKAAFSVHIDRRTDEVYVSDSTRHVIRKYSGDGMDLANPVSGFHFPNDLTLHEQQLFIADTNHHRVRAVSPDSLDFGTVYYDIDVVPADAAAAGETWPSHIARVKDGWWVNNMKTGMNYGGIYAFDREWQFQRRIDLPGNADPIAILPFGDVVLISDWYGDRIHRVQPDGQVIGDFMSAGLQQILQESVTARQKFRIYGWAAIGNGVILILLLLFKGITRNDEASPPAGEAVDRTAAADTMIWIEPEPKHVRSMRTAVSFGRWLAIPLIGVLVVLCVVTANARAIFDMLIAIAGFVSIYVLANWITRVNTNTAIGLQGEFITLRDHTGKEIRYRDRQIYYNERFVASDEIAVFLGQPQLPLYNPKQVIAEIAARFPRSQRISQWAMSQKLVGMRNPNGIALLVMLFLLGLVSIAWLVRNTL